MVSRISTGTIRISGKVSSAQLVLSSPGIHSFSPLVCPVPNLQVPALIPVWIVGVAGEHWRLQENHGSNLIHRRCDEVQAGTHHRILFVLTGTPPDIMVRAVSTPETNFRYFTQRR